MLNGLSASLSGILSGLTGVATRADNIANATTPGFNARRAHQVTQPGGGSRIGATPQDLSQGPLEIDSGSPFHLAIQGDGYFRVDTPRGDRFTRSGQFSLDAGGRIVDPQGNPLAGVDPIPDGVTDIRIGGDGRISGVNADGAPVELGQIPLARFRNPNGLVAAGNSQFAAGAASGPPLDGLPGQGPFGSLLGGALEGSNVDLTTEVVGQIGDANAVRVNIAAFKAQNDLLGEIIDLVQ